MTDLIMLLSAPFIFVGWLVFAGIVGGRISESEQRFMQGRSGTLERLDREAKLAKQNGWYR